MLRALYSRRVEYKFLRSWFSAIGQVKTVDGPKPKVNASLNPYSPERSSMYSSPLPRGPQPSFIPSPSVFQVPDYARDITHVT